MMGILMIKLEIFYEFQNLNYFQQNDQKYIIIEALLKVNVDKLNTIDEIKAKLMNNGNNNCFIGYPSI